MNRFIAAALLMGSALLVVNCAPATRFNWGSYEDSLYGFYKSPDQRAAYKKALTDAIDRGRKENKVAPGLLAELGYLYLEDGNTAQARELFQEEMTRFPEARPFLIRIIDNSGTAPTASASGAMP